MIPKLQLSHNVNRVILSCTPVFCRTMVKSVSINKKEQLSQAETDQQGKGCQCQLSWHPYIYFFYKYLQRWVPWKIKSFYIVYIHFPLATIWKTQPPLKCINRERSQVLHHRQHVLSAQDVWSLLHLTSVKYCTILLFPTDKPRDHSGPDL